MRAPAFFLILFLTVVGCGRFESRYRETSPELIRGTWDKEISEGREYTGYTVQALESYGQSLMDAEPADIDSFCPNYRNRDHNGRVGFWVGLISAMAKRESDYRTDSDYQESFNGKDGKPIVSRGLLQVSFDSTKQYECNFTSPEEIHDAQKNLECGVKMIAKLVERDKVISGRDVEGQALGLSRYWAVVRDGHAALVEIRQLTRALEVCSD